MRMCVFVGGKFACEVLKKLIYIIVLTQEIAVNWSKLFEQNFLLDRVFFEKLRSVHFSINFV